MANRNSNYYANLIKPWANIANVIAIPIILLLIGNSFAKSTKKQEIEGKYVEISIGILSQEPSDNNKDTRQWAIDVINKYSGVPMGKAAQKELRNNALYGSGCTGSDDCTDCKNCEYCKFCSKDGGKCGVCK